MERHYTNIGETSGSCGHRHSTLSGLARCFLRHRHACRVNEASSDRHPFLVQDGEAPARLEDCGKVHTEWLATLKAVSTQEFIRMSGKRHRRRER